MKAPHRFKRKTSNLNCLFKCELGFKSTAYTEIITVILLELYLLFPKSVYDVFINCSASEESNNLQTDKKMYIRVSKDAKLHR